MTPSPQTLTGKKVAILVTDGFEQSEYESPKQALESAGAKTITVALKPGKVRGWKNKNWGDEFPVDIVVSNANEEEFDALVLPGGVMSPDKLRDDDDAVDFVRAFELSQKPIAAICHGPSTLINAGAVKGKRVTSYSSIRIDLENAGARWVDQSVVTDQGLVTSRNPNDLPDFNAKMLEEFSEGRHTQRPVSGTERHISK